jgi:t-SNARE complex subunit (syntaxin)
VLGTCCWIVPTVLAIPAIVFGAQVNTKLASGDAMGAAEASRNARIWCWVSFVSVLVIALVWLAFVGVLAIGAA